MGYDAMADAESYGHDAGSWATSLGRPQEGQDIVTDQSRIDRAPVDSERFPAILTRMGKSMMARITRCPCRKMPYLDHISRTLHVRNEVDPPPVWEFDLTKQMAALARQYGNESKE